MNAPPSADARVAALAGRQYGVVTYEQLVGAGLDRHAIRRRVKSGRLHRVHRRVYAVGHAALSREGRWLAGVLAAGPGAALSHLSAAELCALGRFRSPLIAVVVPQQRRIPGVVTHRATRLDPRDVTVYKRIPVTTVARMLVDLSDVLTPHQLAHVINEAAYRRRFNLQATREAMARANGRRNLHVLERAIALYLSGSAGTRSRRDVVEVDGPGHERPTAKCDDAHRDEALVRAGYDTLRVTDVELEYRPDEVVRRVRQASDAAARTPPGG